MPSTEPDGCGSGSRSMRKELNNPPRRPPAVPKGQSCGTQGGIHPTPRGVCHAEMHPLLPRAASSGPDFAEVRSGPQEGLDRAALVHRSVGLGDLVEWEGEVEHLSWLDAAVPNAFEEVGQVRPYGGRAAAQANVLPEHVGLRQVCYVWHADPADHRARADAAEGLYDGVVGADALEGCVGADAMGELLDLRDALIATFGDDVCGAEVTRQGLSVRMPAHRDDTLSTELGSSQHSGQAHRAVADHHDGAAGPDVGAHGGVPTGTHDVGQREDARYDVVARVFGSGEKSAIGVLYADQLCLAAVVAGHALAVGVGAHLADRAGVVAGEEAADDELPGVHRAHLVAD